MRILIERGRVFYQEGDIEAAGPLFKQSYELSAKNQFDYHTVDAAHMMPFVAKSAKEKIKWNKRAIKMATHSESVQAQKWLGSLYNNIGQAYLEDKQYEKALPALEQALKYREQEDYAPNIRVGKWAVARTLRLLNRSDEALPMLQELLDEYDSMVEAGESEYARLAYDDLSCDEWFKKLEPQRLEKLKRLSQPLR